MLSTPSSPALFVLADCNNFYVSCERLFNPALEGKPVIVLSSKGGCILARSQEAKKLGIPMGAPFFEWKELCERNHVHALCCRHNLYGDISRRVMTILTMHAPEIEVYSIDEAFLRYSKGKKPDEILIIANELRSQIKRWTGIPISIGIAPTKTLAKVANHLAKKGTGIFDLSCPAQRETLLSKWPIREIWGIGRRLEEKLHKMGIQTAHDFSKQDPLLIRKKMGVVGERMLFELRGIPCLSIDERTAKKSITYSRSFEHVLTEKGELAQALATYATNAASKMRGEKSAAAAIYIYLEAQIAPGNHSRITYGHAGSFDRPTNDTRKILAMATQLLNRVYQPNKRYKKCGIVLLDLLPEENILPDFLLPIDPRSKILMKTVDSLNMRFGKNSLFFGALGIKNNCSSPQHLTAVSNREM